MTKRPAHYFVTDIESDGPSPISNSMLSFATVVVREDGALRGEFEAVLEQRSDRQPDPKTMAFWETIPQAWAAARENPEPPESAMLRFVEWVESYPEPRSFAARPLAFDGIWIDHYLRDFADRYLLDVPHWGRALFTSGALDLGSYIAGLFNRTDPPRGDTVFPPDWLGEHEHTHRAIDDARGYACVLSRLLRIAAAEPAHPQDFMRSAD